MKTKILLKCLFLAVLFSFPGFAQYTGGNGSGYSVKEVFDAINAVTGKHPNITIGPRRLGDPATLIADASLAEKNLGWKPAFPQLETIVHHAWQALC